MASKNLNNWLISKSINTQINWIYAAVVSCCWISNQFFEEWVCICNHAYDCLLTSHVQETLKVWSDCVWRFWSIYDVSFSGFWQNCTYSNIQVINLMHKFNRQWKLHKVCMGTCETKQKSKQWNIFTFMQGRVGDMVCEPKKEVSKSIE